VGPLILVVGWALYSIGDLTLIQAFWHGGAVLVVIGCLLAVGGRQLLVRFLPAFLVLAFLVPVPGTVRQAIALPLQATTAKITQGALDLLGVETGRSGNVLVINGTRVAIVEACNGLRMVFALILVSVTFALGTPLRGYVRALVILASPLSAIFCNVLRLIPTVWMYGNESHQAAEWFHDVSGWVMLPVAFLLLMGIIRVLRWALIPVHRFTLAYGV
jgi:exosortase